jgi:hypothetical protein
MDVLHQAVGQQAALAGVMPEQHGGIYDQRSPKAKKDGEMRSDLPGSVLDRWQ